MRNALRLSPLVVVVLLGGCATLPNGPSVLVLPGTGRNFDEFRADDAACRNYAYQQVGGVTSAEAASDSADRSGAVGTVLGAAAGAAMGGGRGAAVGAGCGLLLGGLTGAGAGERAGYALQQRYDFSYEQCMYAKGHRIPESGPFTPAPEQRYYPPPPPPAPSAPKGAPTR